MSIITSYKEGDRVMIPQYGNQPNIPGTVHAVEDRNGAQVVTATDIYGGLHTVNGWELALAADEDEDVDEEAVIETWDEDVETVIEAINDGYLDKHLRDIAKAAIDRYQEIRGTDLVKKKPSFNGDDEDDAPASSNGAATVPQTNLLAQGSVLPQPNGDVLINGQRYRKSDLMNKTIVIQPQAKWSNGEYDGRRVVISGIGKKMAKVDWVDPPPQGSGMERRIAKQMPTFVPFSVLSPYLVK